MLRNGGGGSKKQGGGDTSPPLLNSRIDFWEEGRHWKGWEANGVERFHPEKLGDRRHHQNLWSVKIQSER